MTDEKKPLQTDESTQILTGEGTSSPSEETMAAASPAEAFVKSELAAARKTLRRTQIYGSLVVIVVGLYLSIISFRLADNLKPNKAAEILTGLVAAQIEQHRDAFVSEVRERVPAMIQHAPDYAIEQMPIYRASFEQKFEEQLQKYCQSTSDKLAANLDQYIVENKEQIKAVLELGKDPKAVEELGANIRAQVEEYLKEQPEEGKSIGEQIDESLRMLDNAEQRLNRLATADDLTPAEKKTRRAIAIIAKTVEAEQLTPISLPQFEPQEE